MAQDEPQQIKVEPDDPQYQLEEHIAYKRRTQSLNYQLKRLIQQNLGEFRQIMDGSNYAYTKLGLANKGLVIVSDIIAEYPHLRNIDFSSNQISDTMHIQKLRFVTHLNLSRNLINDGRFMSNGANFPYLKSLNLANNKLKVLPSLMLENVVHLNLNNNLITHLEDFDGHAKLEVLELRGNKISKLKGLEKATALKQLYVADNGLTSLNGLANLPQLQKLHARKNKITDLADYPKLVSVKYLNLRENQIAKVPNLNGVNDSVAILNLLANPISQQLGDNTKKEVWMKFRHYQKINKSEVTAEERDQFDKEYKERLAEQERQQKQARQQAERQAAEAAQKQNQE